MDLPKLFCTKQGVLFALDDLALASQNAGNHRMRRRRGGSYFRLLADRSPVPADAQRSLAETDAICTIFIARLANYPVSTNRTKAGDIARPLMPSISPSFQPD